MKAELAYVVIGSKSSGAKALALSVAEVGPDVYVPGASIVFVRGPVSRVSPLSGEFEVGGTRVVGLVGELPALNASVDVVGTQPLLGDAVVANVVAPTPSAKAAADTTLSNVIVGSGASSNVIVGSGSTTSVIVGSGSSTNVIVGSGKSSNVIVGSGASTNVIVGSGKSTNVIVGSGASTNVIVGSGLQ